MRVGRQKSRMICFSAIPCTYYSRNSAIDKISVVSMLVECYAFNIRTSTKRNIHEILCKYCGAETGELHLLNSCLLYEHQNQKNLPKVACNATTGPNSIILDMVPLNTSENGGRKTKGHSF